MKQLKTKDYERIKAMVDKTYKIMNNIDSPMHKCMLILEEVKHIAGVEIALLCLGQAKGWYEDHNPHRADILLKIAKHNGFHPTPTMLEVVTDARTTTKAKGKTEKKLIEEASLNQALSIICNMIYYGIGVEKACSKVAQWRKDTYPDLKQIKASVLQKKYAKAYRQNSETGHQAIKVTEETTAQKNQKLLSQSLVSSTKKPKPPTVNELVTESIISALKLCSTKEEQERLIESYSEPTPFGLSIEKQFHQSWDRFYKTGVLDDSTRKKWLEIIAALPEADDSLKGTIR